MTILDLASVRRDAEDIAREAGQLIMTYFRRPESQQQTLKGSPFDIVTAADKASEQRIIDALTQRYPTHHIIGEEGGGMGAPRETAPYLWVVDPIDGTTNFANGIPIFAVSIALLNAQMEALLGVVYNPAQDELFSAAQGQGAACNGDVLSVSSAENLAESVLASGFPYSKYSDPDNNLAQWGHFLTRTRGLRRLGSAALDMCYVAAGRFDGYWEMRLNPWDYLAGLVCVRESGGQVTDYLGQENDIVRPLSHIVASNGHIHQQIINNLAETGAAQLKVPGAAL